MCRPKRLCDCPTSLHSGEMGTAGTGSEALKRGCIWVAAVLVAVMR